MLKSGLGVPPSRIEGPVLGKETGVQTQEYAAPEDSVPLVDSSRQALPCYFAQIPHEILLAIFRNSLPPPWLLNGAARNVLTPQSLYSIDLTAKLSIVAVCKDWNQVGTELLYEIVHLRRIGQLPAFVRALEEHAGLGDLVKRLDLSCMVPRGYSTLFECETRNLLHLCPRISHFGFIPVFLVPTVACSLPNLGAGITNLEFSSAVDFSALVFPVLLELCNGLQYLSFNPPPSREDLEVYDQLEFPLLQDLRLSIKSSDFSLFRWQMPSLRRLWLYCTVIPPIARLLDAYGRSLTFLSLSFLKTVEPLQDILPKCPSLEHLVLGLRILGVPACDHRRLKYIDCWEASESRTSASTEFNLLKPGFPALRRLRYFDTTFVDLWELPVLFPPEEGAGSDPSSNDIEDLQNGERDPKKLPWLAAVLEFTEPESINGWTFADDEEEDDDDGSVQPFVVDVSSGVYESDPEDYSDSDSGSCITVSEEGGTLVYLRNQFSDDEDDFGEIDRATALEIFSRTITEFD
ncbi:hypothetical protein C8F04DRAFT_1066887 [Mycena alexandri]|uniref:F-box domain-containing protein n=1 Tax=Mycena alexandri TaxID=1745969 RepID=A0AAD6XI17_9AGAR|nr:hypothetical protein C8F04DRAFT_1066887 [Mycena alexandri]